MYGLCLKIIKVIVRNIQAGVNKAGFILNEDVIGCYEMAKPIKRKEATIQP